MELSVADVLDSRPSAGPLGFRGGKMCLTQHAC